MNEMVDFSDVQYAVIAGLRTETGPERLVIAYTNEKSLRELIAARSIIALGFSSREAAVEGRRAADPTAGAYHRKPETMAGRRIEGDQEGLNRAEWRRKPFSTLLRLVSFVVTYYRDIVSGATVILSSSNSVSAVIRMALGSSV